MHLSTELSHKRALLKKGGGLQSFITSAIKKIPIAGIVNSAIDSLPIELHLPGGYQYCGPGTKLKERLTRGDPGINKLDQACKEHDISYSKYSDSEHRSVADRALAEKAWQRVQSSDASVGEKAAALAVTAAMKAKTAIGGGNKRKRRTSKKQNKKRGGRIKRRRTSLKKKSSNLWSMIRSGRGLYLRPYRRVY